MIMDEDEYQEMVEDCMGFCMHCNKFTRESTEPDARDYECPECGNATVIGAEEALMNGCIEFGEEEE